MNKYKKQRNEKDCLKDLSKKKDIRIIQERKVLLLEDRPKEKKNDLGNKSWGKIDFLKKIGWQLVLQSTI